MPNMTISLELVTAGASAEVEVEVEFTFAPGSPGYFNAMTGDGEAPYGPEVEVEHIWWPYQKFVAAKGETASRFVDDVFDAPLGAIPDGIIEDIVNTIIENYNPADDAPDRG